MPYYLGKVPLRAELPELAEEVSAAKTSPQQVQPDLGYFFLKGTDGGGCIWCVNLLVGQGTLSLEDVYCLLELRWKM